MYKSRPATPFLLEAPRGWYAQQQMAFAHLWLKYMHLVQDFAEHIDQGPPCSIFEQPQSSIDEVQKADTKEISICKAINCYIYPTSFYNMQITGKCCV